MKLYLYPDAQSIGLLLADGRICGFDYVEEIDEVDFCRNNRLELRKGQDGYVIYSLDNQLFYHFTCRDREDGHLVYRLTSLSDADNRKIRFDYSNGKLGKITDNVGRIIEVQHTDEGFISALYLRLPDGSREKLVGYGYDNDGNMTEITDALDKTTRISYEQHRMVSKTLWPFLWLTH